jgi:hypothetical protein
MKREHSIQMVKRRITWLWLAAVMGLNACVSIETVIPPTATPEPATPTATFDFPTLVPTRTSTPMPTATPTPDLISGLGPVVYRDTFTNDTGWTGQATTNGGYSFVNGWIRLAVRVPNAAINVYSPPLELRDFYLEMTIRPDLCSEDDEAGFLFRVVDPLNYYRFSMTCQGGARVTRIIDGGEVAIIPITETFAAFPGALVENQIAVLASGPVMTFFINGTEVFTAQEATFTMGGLGLYVHSRRSGQMTVSFDDLIVRDLLPPPEGTTTSPSP